LRFEAVSGEFDNVGPALEQLVNTLDLRGKRWWLEGVLIY